MSKCTEKKMQLLLILLVNELCVQLAYVNQILGVLVGGPLDCGKLCAGWSYNNHCTSISNGGS